MPRGILLVESQPTSPEDLSAYHSWYDDVHVPEMLALDGFVSARRLESLDGGSFIAVYEIDTDVEEARATLEAAMAAGSLSRPTGVQLNPPPAVHFYKERT